MKTSKTLAFTLIELLVVISIIAILAGIALPVFSQVQVKGAQTKALSNAKQIATGLKLYAVDNSGVFPSNTTGSSPTAVQTANDALCQLIPEYIPTEDIFWLAKSGWCSSKPQGPDNIMDQPMVSPASQTLSKGENEWAYVINLNDTSNAAYPLLCDAFVSGGSTSHNYTTDPTTAGGVWKGKQAIVVHVDTSAAVMKVEQYGYTIQGYNGGQANGDIFSIAQPATWLGTSNTVVLPK